MTTEIIATISIIINLILLILVALLYEDWKLQRYWKKKYQQVLNNFSKIINLK
jgi:hypothetical protein